jgi:hypothetical protein
MYARFVFQVSVLLLLPEKIYGHLKYYKPTYILQYAHTFPDDHVGHGGVQGHIGLTNK